MKKHLKRLFALAFIPLILTSCKEEQNQNNNSNDTNQTESNSENENNTNNGENGNGEGENEKKLGRQKYTPLRFAEKLYYEFLSEKY